jgi:hypothetical protein
MRWDLPSQSQRLLKHLLDLFWPLRSLQTSLQRATAGDDVILSWSGSSQLACISKPSAIGCDWLPLCNMSASFQPQIEHVAVVN